METAAPGASTRLRGATSTAGENAGPQPILSLLNKAVAARALSVHRSEACSSINAGFAPRPNKPGQAGNTRMKTQVEFRSSKFPPCEGEEDEINPGLWGRRLTEYLAAKLAEKGIETEEMAIEDWGCYLPIRNDGFRLALCCGHQNGNDDQFLVFTDPGTPKVRKWFRTVDATPQLTRLLEALREILEADSEIRNIEWSDYPR